MDDIDSITLDVPLLIRLLEHAREDIKTDAQLHEVVTRVIALSKTGVEILGMEQYSQIVGETPVAKLKAIARIQETSAMTEVEKLRSKNKKIRDKIYTLKDRNTMGQHDPKLKALREQVRDNVEKIKNLQGK